MAALDHVKCGRYASNTSIALVACKWIILMRRSVLEQMLEAANWAPTHGRTEPWRFVVLGADTLQEMISITDRVSMKFVMIAKKFGMSALVKHFAHAVSLTLDCSSQHQVQCCQIHIFSYAAGNSRLMIQMTWLSLLHPSRSTRGPQGPLQHIWLTLDCLHVLGAHKGLTGRPTSGYLNILHCVRS